MGLSLSRGGLATGQNPPIQKLCGAIGTAAVKGRTQGPKRCVGILPQSLYK